MSHYKDIFFDLDHTIWDFDTNSRLSLEDLFSELSIQEKTGTDFSDFYEKYLIHNKVLWKRYQDGFISSEELKWKRMWRTLLEYGVADENLSKQMGYRFLEILPTKKEVFPYTVELLTYLTNKKYELHIISNGFEKTQHSKLEHSGLKKYFKQIITSEASNCVKPQKEIFDYAVKLASTSIADSIMIGDNPDADIAGAIGAGMDRIYVNFTGAEIKEKPTYTVTHLKEIEGIL